MPIDDSSYPSAFAITGMPNAGKSTAGRMLSEVGYEVYEVGDAVRQVERHLDTDVEDRGELIEEMKEEHGPDYFVRQMIDLYNVEPDAEVPQVIVGIRQSEEREFLEQYFGDLETVTITANENNRRERFWSRGKLEDEEGSGFDERDERELSQGIGGPALKSANAYVNNDGEPEDMARELAEKLDFQPYLYDVKNLPGTILRSVKQAEFRYPEHARMFAERKRYFGQPEPSKLIFVEWSAKTDELEEDIQNFYAKLMTEGLE